MNELKLEQFKLESEKNRLALMREERIVKIAEYIYSFLTKCITGVRLPFTALLILGLTGTISSKDVADIFKLIINNIFEKSTYITISLFISLFANCGLGIWIYILRKQRIEPLASENAKLKAIKDSRRTSSNLKPTGVSRSEDT